MFDICIIGAGVIGCAIARVCARYNLEVCLIEKNEDVGTGTSKANSGIVHGGYHSKNGSLKAKLAVKGNHLYQQLNDELHFGFERCGSFVVGYSDDDRKVIHELYENGIKNGVKGLEIVGRDFILQKEPYVNPEVIVALYCASAGITSPYECTIALAENAIENGVELKLNTEITAIEKQKDHFILRSNRGEFFSHFVINAAGLYGDHIAHMVGVRDIHITSRQGQYILLDKDQGYLASSVIFQTPTPVSKGILVTKTYHGNLLIGPNAEVVLDKENLDTTAETIDHIIKMARKSVQDFDIRKVITEFSGNRASSNREDFIIEESEVKQFINVIGIESPGLTAAPAIALEVLEILKKSGLILKEKASFNPNRRPYHLISKMTKEEINEIIKKDPAYGRVVCRCETVSEGEILDALRRPIPIDTLDAIKRRVRAGMGRCQGGFCTPRLLEILYDELGIPIEEISKKSEGSRLVIGRTKRALEKREKEHDE